MQLLHCLIAFEMVEESRPRWVLLALSMGSWFSTNPSLFPMVSVCETTHFGLLGVDSLMPVWITSTIAAIGWTMWSAASAASAAAAR